LHIKVLLLTIILLSNQIPLKMKRPLRTLLTLILAGFAFSALSQDRAVVLADYMQVKPDKVNRYLELENEWKKIHEARLEKGFITGWQLWQKMYGAPEDKYQYITLNWYENFEKSSNAGTAEVLSELYNEKEREELVERTLKARDEEITEVMHRALSTENNSQTSYIVIYRMKVEPSKEQEYVRMEQEIFKPLYEEAIKRGEMSTWSIWKRWPFEDDDYQFVAVNGFKDFAEIDDVNFPDLFETVHPELDIDELNIKVNASRKVTSVEIWRLIDAVMQESGHE